MKALLATLTLLSLNAHADPVIGHPLNQGEIAGLEEIKTSPFLLSYNSGYVTVNAAKKEIRLAVHQNTCLEGSRQGEIDSRGCNIENETVFVYEIVSEGNSCGSKVYEARQVAGGFAQSTSTISLADHRGRLCRDLRRHTTEIFQKIQGRGRTLENYFGASRLAPPYER